MTEVATSGAVWGRSPRARAQMVRRVCEALETAYEPSRLGNPENPLDDLIFVILSNKTGPRVALRTYEEIKREFPTWEDVLAAPRSTIERILKPAGLAKVRSQQILGALQKIRDDFGSCDLAALRGRSEVEAQEYLVSLPGVSEKVAKCVMIWTMGAEVLPVDAHVHRVTRRLGWTARKRADQCHEELEALVPPCRRRAFHADCILHGRSVCRPVNPACEVCRISGHCLYHVAEEWRE